MTLKLLRRMYELLKLQSSKEKAIARKKVKIKRIHSVS